MNTFYLKLIKNMGLPFNPFYHTVSNENLNYCNQIFKYKGINTFINELESMTKVYKFIDLEEYTKKKLGENKLEKNETILSFDDGYKECFEIIAPILYQKGIPAVFFINTYYIGNTQISIRNKVSILLNILDEKSIIKNKNKLKFISRILGTQDSIVEIKKKLIQFRNSNEEGILDQISQVLDFDDKDYLLKNKPYLNLNQLVGMCKKGFNLGNHTSKHEYLQKLDQHGKYKEINDADSFFQEKLNLNEVPISIPFNDMGLSDNDLENLTKSKNRLIFGSGNIYERKTKIYINRYSPEYHQGNTGIKTYMKEYFKYKIKSYYKDLTYI